MTPIPRMRLAETRGENAGACGRCVPRDTQDIACRVTKSARRGPRRCSCGRTVAPPRGKHYYHRRHSMHVATLADAQSQRRRGKYYTCTHATCHAASKTYSNTQRRAHTIAAHATHRHVSAESSGCTVYVPHTLVHTGIGVAAAALNAVCRSRCGCACIYIFRVSSRVAENEVCLLAKRVCVTG